MTFSLAQLLGVAAGGALGASSRYLFLVFAQGGAGGILLLNVAGSFLLGLLLTAASGKSPMLLAFAGTGLLGALTTYSTFSGDLVRLAADSPYQALGYGGASVCFGILAFLAGSWLGRAL